MVGEGRPYRPREVSRALGLPVLGCVEWDSRRAEVFSVGAEKPQPGLGGAKRVERAFAGSSYMRSVASLGDSMGKAAAGRGRESLLQGMVAQRVREGAGA
jgi:hypothetical protein